MEGVLSLGFKAYGFADLGLRLWGPKALPSPKLTRKPATPAPVEASKTTTRTGLGFRA